jgi:hypothetical protein
VGLETYTIWSPEYSHFSGGLRALKVLRSELIKRGFEAYFHFEKQVSDSIIIYPEIIKDNPLNFDKRVRWLLNKETFEDLSFAWVEGMGVENLLTVNIYELDLFSPRKTERKGIGYWVGKGSVQPDVLPDDAQRIHKFQPASREELANLLASFEYVISFDEFSSINTECALLGTPVIIYPTTNWSKEEIMKISFCVDSFAWSLDELPQAKERVQSTFEEYKAFLTVIDSRIDKFVDITQKAFS